jgi:FlaA1/EpsC-like NDP-sugar epimerase
MIDAIPTRSVGPLRQWLAGQPRQRKRLYLVSFDAVVLVVLVWLSFCFRFGALFMPNFDQTLIMLAAPVVAIPIFIRMGLYRSVLRYLPERAIWTIMQAVTIAILVWVSLAFLTRMTGIEGIPRTVPVVFWILAFVVVVGSRFGAKRLLGGRTPSHEAVTRTIIYGAGDAGMQLADALRSSSDRRLMGFFSDDSSLHGLDVRGLRVYSPADLEQTIYNLGIGEVIVTAPDSGQRRDLVAHMGTLPVKIRILPAIADLAAGKYLVSYIREIDIDDLLGRSQVPADLQLLRARVENKVVLVTGAAGSIGSAVCRTIAELKPSRLILVEFNEHGLYQIARELTQKAAFPVEARLGSVANADFVDRVLGAAPVDTIYHCAAFKHVSLVEENVLEAVSNNVFGTHVLVEAACRHDVANLVLISSDKAVHPASVMGATKRWSELIVGHFAAKAASDGVPRNFSSVRFGNVIGSSGSVVPLFKEQIANGGPVTVTHNDMTRYFMSVREAAELIIQAGALSQSGDTLLLEMGEPIRIRQLAEEMIALAGLTLRDEANLDGDIDIVVIGPRPGEKLSEDLFYDPAGIAATSHPKILRGKRVNGLAPDLPELIEALGAALAGRCEEATRRILFDVARRGLPASADEARKPAA